MVNNEKERILNEEKLLLYHVNGDRGTGKTSKVIHHIKHKEHTEVFVFNPSKNDKILWEQDCKHFQDLNTANLSRLLLQLSSMKNDRVCVVFDNLCYKYKFLNDQIEMIKTLSITGCTFYFITQLSHHLCKPLRTYVQYI